MGIPRLEGVLRRHIVGNIPATYYDNYWAKKQLTTLSEGGNAATEHVLASLDPQDEEAAAALPVPEYDKIVLINVMMDKQVDFNYLTSLLSCFRFLAF